MAIKGFRDAIIQNGLTTSAGLCIAIFAARHLGQKKNINSGSKLAVLLVSSIAFATFAYGCGGSLGNHFFRNNINRPLLNTLGRVTVQLTFGSAINLAAFVAALNFWPQNPKSS